MPLRPKDSGVLPSVSVHPDPGRVASGGSPTGSPRRSSASVDICSASSPGRVRDRVIDHVALWSKHRHGRHRSADVRPRCRHLLPSNAATGTAPFRDTHSSGGPVRRTRLTKSGTQKQRPSLRKSTNRAKLSLKQRAAMSTEGSPPSGRHRQLTAGRTGGTPVPATDLTGAPRDSVRLTTSRWHRLGRSAPMVCRRTAGSEAAQGGKEPPCPASRFGAGGPGGPVPHRFWQCSCLGRQHFVGGGGRLMAGACRGLPTMPPRVVQQLPCRKGARFVPRSREGRN